MNYLSSEAPLPIEYIYLRIPFLHKMQAPPVQQVLNKSSPFLTDRQKYTTLV